MTTQEAIQKLNEVDIALAFLSADALDNDRADESENLEAARNHICDAADSLKNNT